VSRVIVVGSVNHDVVVDVETLPAPGETVLARGMRTAFGGKGANQADAAARTAPEGVAVVMVGAVGSDDAGAAMRAALVAAGVDVSALRTVDGPSGTAIITVDSAGENTIAVVAGANAVWPDVVVGVELAPDDVVVLQAEIPFEVIAATIAAADATGAAVLLNAAPAAPELAVLLPSVDILVVNESEAAALIGLQGVGDDALRTAADGRTLVVTLGADGVVLVEGGAVTRIPAVPVEAVDTVGAGDAFVGALAAALAGGASLMDAARLGTAAGAITATAVGARHPELSVARLSALLDRD
jgi:ribokinase